MRIPGERFDRGERPSHPPAVRRPESAADSLLDLQRRAGNTAVSRMIALQRGTATAEAKTALTAAVTARDWKTAVATLTSFDDDEVVRETSHLSAYERSQLRSTAAAMPEAGGAGGKLYRLLNAVAGVAVKTRTDEQVGGNVFTVTGGYTWRITPATITIQVGMNFKPDPGVTAPMSDWFGYIVSTWNKFTAVNQQNPEERKRIEFEPRNAAGHDIRVSAGNGRANAGRYYVGATDMDVTVPHEFGHLIGLEDEYERDAKDFQRLTGQTPKGDASAAAKAKTVAEGLHSALFLKESFFERHKTAERRRMRAVEKLLHDEHVAYGFHHKRSAFTYEVALQYSKLYGAELSAHVMSQVDSGDDEFSTWREQVLGTFQFTYAGIMGAKTDEKGKDHSHSVEPRHVRTFAGHVQQAVGHGKWVPQ